MYCTLDATITPKILRVISMAPVCTRSAAISFFATHGVHDCGMDFCAGSSNMHRCVRNCTSSSFPSPQSSKPAEQLPMALMQQQMLAATSTRQIFFRVRSIDRRCMLVARCKVGTNSARVDCAAPSWVEVGREDEVRWDFPKKWRTVSICCEHR